MTSEAGRPPMLSTNISLVIYPLTQRALRRQVPLPSAMSDPLRIVDSRWEHLAWMRDHWADEVLTAGALGEGGADPE
jgi:hypothetical protein